MFWNRPAKFYSRRDSPSTASESEAYKDYPEKEKFFRSYFDVLAGGPVLREQIIKGMTADEIRATWTDGLEKYSRMREKYLLYK